MKILDYKSSKFWSELDGISKQARCDGEISKAVADVIDLVRRDGDGALRALTKKFDGADVKNFKVSAAEFAAARKTVSKADFKAISEAVKCVKSYNKKTLPQNWRATNPQGAVVGENFYPIERVGLYIPGGSAPLVSTVVMTVTLAKIAGCREICVCTPPTREGKVDAHILCALSILGVDEVYKVGGSQAIAAMGVGTKTVKRVEKIFGPGNAFVIEAKRQLFGEVGCDLLPGPSEIMIIADSRACPRNIAADLLSQAEHGSGREKIYFVSLSKKLMDEVDNLLEPMASALSRAEKLLKIIRDGCVCVSVPSVEAAVKIANFIAPEHLELQVSANAESLAKKITTAGAILLGRDTPTVLGDFTAGPSHTLPTGRTGRFSSGLTVRDFMRRSSIVKYDKKSLVSAAPVVRAFAQMERLDAHAASLFVRLEK